MALLKVATPIIKSMGSGPTWTSALNLMGKRLLGKKFIGALAPSQIPPRLKKQPDGTCWLWNTTSSGEHWGATICFSDGKRYSYDSYGRNGTLVKARHDLPQRMQKNTWSEDDPEQTKDSAICGPLSLAWLVIASDDLNLALLI